MTRVPPMASPAPPGPGADKPRLVVRYSGLQIFDARETIRVVIEGDLPRGVRWTLRNEGFIRRSDTTWEAPATPLNITAAQAIGATFFGEQETP